MKRLAIAMAGLLAMPAAGWSGCDDKRPAPPATEQAPREASEAEGSPLAQHVLPSGHSWRVGPGEYAEVDFALRQGASVKCVFRANGRLMVEAHTHLSDDEIHVFGRDFATEGDLDFKAPFDGVFSFLWAHAGDPDQTVELDAVLQGEAAFVLWSPDDLDVDAPPRRLSQIRAAAGSTGGAAAVGGAEREAPPP